MSNVHLQLHYLQLHFFFLPVVKKKTSKILSSVTFAPGIHWVSSGGTQSGVVTRPRTLRPLHSTVRLPVTLPALSLYPAGLINNLLGWWRWCHRLPTRLAPPQVHLSSQLWCKTQRLKVLPAACLNFSGFRCRNILGPWRGSREEMDMNCWRVLGLIWKQV